MTIFKSSASLFSEERRIHFSVVTSTTKKNFQISSCFIFRDIHVCILSIRCFLCVLHVLLTDSSIFARFHSVSRIITSQEKKEEYISVLTNFQISSVYFCMFYWQIRQFSLGSIQFQEELHLRKRKKNTFQCSDQFSNLQLVYFQRYTRLYFQISS